MRGWRQALGQRWNIRRLHADYDACSLLDNLAWTPNHGDFHVRCSSLCSDRLDSGEPVSPEKNEHVWCRLRLWGKVLRGCPTAIWGASWLVPGFQPGVILWTPLGFRQLKEHPARHSSPGPIRQHHATVGLDLERLF